MSRYLGIDYGARRIGLAVSDSAARLASPLHTLSGLGGRAQEIDAIRRVIDEFGITELVVGLPLNMDGTEGSQAKKTRSFGDALGKATSLPVHYFDERLSSFAADELLESAELSRKKHKAVHDTVAAQVILQSFLDQRT